MSAGKGCALSVLRRTRYLRLLSVQDRKVFKSYNYPVDRSLLRWRTAFSISSSLRPIILSASAWYSPYKGQNFSPSSRLNGKASAITAWRSASRIFRPTSSAAVTGSGSADCWPDETSGASITNGTNAAIAFLTDRLPDNRLTRLSRARRQTAIKKRALGSACANLIVGDPTTGYCSRSVEMSDGALRVAPMPPNATVPDAELHAMITWILAVN